MSGRRRDWGELACRDGKRTLVEGWKELKDEEEERGQLRSK